MSLQQSLTAGRTGIESSYQHSLLETPTFEAEALNTLQSYCERHAEVFIEDVSSLYAGLGLPLPANPKAWGKLTQIAKKRGWLSLEPCGSKRRVFGHGTYGPVWKSLIVRGAR